MIYRALRTVRGDSERRAGRFTALERRSGRSFQLVKYTCMENLLTPEGLTQLR